MNQPFILMPSSRGIDSVSPLSYLLSKRIIYLQGEVDDELSTNIITQLKSLELQDHNDDIDLYINSPGGSVSNGLAIYDTIQSLNCKTHTYCIGSCASIAAILFISATGKRCMQDNSTLMIHSPYLITGGSSRKTPSEIEQDGMLLRKDQDKLFKIISEASDHTIKEITERFSFGDTYFTPEEAISYGLCDEVIKPLHQRRRRNAKTKKPSPISG